MLNREFLRRLTFRFARGDGGWLPYYLFYLGTLNSHTGSQLALIDKRPQVGYGLYDPKLFNATFAPHGPNSNTYMGEYPVSCGDHMQFARSGSSKSLDISAGVKQSIALQNYYQGIDTENLQSVSRVPWSAVALDPAVMVDSIDGPFNFDAIVDLYMDPDICNSTTGIQLSKEFIDAVEARLNVGAGGGSYSHDTIYLNPYLSSKDTNGPHMFVTSSNLDYDPSRPFLRFAGHMYGSIHDYMLSDIDADLLKVRLSANPMHQAFINPNCVMLAASGALSWYVPVAAVLSGGTNPTTHVSSVYSSAFNRPSFNVRNFNTTSDPVSVTSDVRPAFNQRVTTLIDRPGDTSRASYRIERYANEMVEWSLTSHLPRVDSNGNDTKYFTELGSYMSANNSGYDYRLYYGCLQPVAFPAAQEPEDHWLWYVSMDEEYNFWLNRQELGRANLSECMSPIPCSPIQMIVFNGRVWMLHGSEIRVFVIATGILNTYTVNTDLPVTKLMTSIAVDREQHRVWVGHETGVFEFTNETFTALDLSALPTSAQYVARQGLSAVNGYLAWNTVEELDKHNEYGVLSEQYVVRWTVASNSGFAWSHDDIAGSAHFVLSTSILVQLNRIGLRSNGDILVLYTSKEETYYYNGPDFSWFKVNTDGTLFCRHYREHLCQTTISFECSLMYVLPIHRIDDFHYSCGAVPFNQPDATRDQYDPLLCSTPTGLFDFRLDEENNFVYVHPGYQEMQADTALHDGWSANFSDVVNNPHTHKALIPFQSLIIRASDFEAAMHSSCPVILDGCFSLFMCGYQHICQMGIEYSWNGANWVHGIAGQVFVSKRMHTDFQNVTPAVKIAFDRSSTGFKFSRSNVYRVDAGPGTSTPLPTSTLYLGDYNVVSESTTIDSSGMITVSVASTDTFCGIDTEQTKDLVCSVDSTQLFFTTGTPGPNDFAVSKAGVFSFDSSNAGKMANIRYNFIRQAV